MNKAVAVVGMCGSGKSVLCKYFTDLGWDSVYFGGVAVSQLVKNNIPVSEASEREIRERLRKELGMGAFAIILKDEISDKLSRNNVVLDGLYSWSEYVILKNLLGDDLCILAVVTNSEIRKERLGKRKVRSLTPEMVDSRDVAEIEHSEKGGPIAKADYYIINNGTEAQLHEQFEKFMQWLQNK